MAMGAGQIATVAQIELQRAKRRESRQTAIDGFDRAFESTTRESIAITRYDTVPWT
jgi:hypothetical protein